MFTSRLYASVFLSRVTFVNQAFVIFHSRNFNRLFWRKSILFPFRSSSVLTTVFSPYIGRNTYLLAHYTFIHLHIRGLILNYSFPYFLWNVLVFKHLVQILVGSIRDSNVDIRVPFLTVFIFVSLFQVYTYIILKSAIRCYHFKLFILLTVIHCFFI